ncbi:glycosyltransferase family 39 protein [Aliikangiella sp. IMCC44653]
MSVLQINSSPKIWLVAIIGIAILMLHSHTYSGAYISMDSLYYFHGAYNWAAGHGVSITDFNSVDIANKALTVWPPLYSGILASSCWLSECVNLNFDETSLKINLIMLVITIYLFFSILKKILPVNIALITCFLFVILPSTQILYTYAWSEVIFLALILLSFQNLTGFLNSRKTSHLIASIVFIAIATYTRYVGVAFALAHVFCLFCQPKYAIIRNLKSALGAGTLYVLLILPLLLYNWSITGSLSGGNRGIPDMRLGSDTVLLFDLYSREWFSGFWLLALLSIFALLTIVVMLIRSKSNLTLASIFERQGTLAIIWFGFYLVFLVISRSFQVVDLDARMLSISWPFLMLFLVSLLWAAYQKLNRPMVISVAAFFVMMLAFSGMRVHSEIVDNKLSMRGVGNINGISYPNLLNSGFDVYRHIADKYQANEREFVITDLNRPILLKYFFSRANVQSIAPYLSLSATDRNNLFATRSGILVLTSRQVLQQIVQASPFQISYKAYRVSKNAAPVIVIELPLKSKESFTKVE